MAEDENAERVRRSRRRQSRDRQVDRRNHQRERSLTPPRFINERRRGRRNQDGNRRSFQHLHSNEELHEARILNAKLQQANAERMRVMQEMSQHVQQLSANVARLEDRQNLLQQEQPPNNEDRVRRLQNSLLESRLEQTNVSRGRIRLRINPFDAQKSSPNTWMEQFERSCEMHGVTDTSKKIDLLRENLAENATNWYESRLINHAPEDWQEWKTRFLQDFMPSTIETIRRAIEFKFRWGSYSDYYYEKENRILKVFPAESKTVMFLIIGGLPDNIAREVLKNRS